MTKGEMMKLVYTTEELRSIDSAIPIGLWDRIDTRVHVVNYNKPYRGGRLENLETESCNRGVDLNEIERRELEDKLGHVKTRR
jgi:hypothetical protein